MIGHWLCSNADAQILTLQYIEHGLMRHRYHLGPLKKCQINRAVRLTRLINQIGYAILNDLFTCYWVLHLWLQYISWVGWSYEIVWLCFSQSNRFIWVWRCWWPLGSKRCSWITACDWIRSDGFRIPDGFIRIRWHHIILTEWSKRWPWNSAF